MVSNEGQAPRVERRVAPFFYYAATPRRRRRPAFPRRLCPAFPRQRPAFPRRRPRFRGDVTPRSRGDVVPRRRATSRPRPRPASSPRRRLGRSPAARRRGRVAAATSQPIRRGVGGRFAATSKPPPRGDVGAAALYRTPRPPRRLKAKFADSDKKRACLTDLARRLKAHIRDTTKGGQLPRLLLNHLDPMERQALDEL